MVHLLEKIEREGMDMSLGMTARAEGLESALSRAIEDAFGKDAPRRIAGAEEQDVVDTVWVDMVWHGVGFLLSEARDSRPAAPP
jgi:hypothetical protein